MHINTCKICGEQFEARFPTVNVCTPCKNRPCEVCGKPFKRTDPYDQKYCSKECRAIGRRDPKNVAVREAKRKATVQAKYGVDNVSKLKDVREKISISKTDPEFYTQMKAEIAEAEAAAKQPLIRQCILCGKDFEATGSQSTCEGPHYKKCIICGKDYEYKHLSDKRQTCSEECRIKLSQNTLVGTVKICEACGKEFTSIGSSTKYCPGPHYRKCAICGKDYEYDPSTEGRIDDYKSQTCSPECTQELRQQTSMERYGVLFPSQTEEAKQHAREVSMSNSEQRKLSNLAKFGYEYASQSPEMKKKISDTIKSTRWQSEQRARMKAKYGVEYLMQSREYASKHSASQFSQVTSDGTRVDSRWEALFYDFLLRNNIEFEYHPVSIPYEYKGQTHVTHIDFKVGDLLFEIKGSHLMQGAYEDSGKVVPIDVKLDVYRKHHVIVVTDYNGKEAFGKPNSKESNGLKYLDKCPEPLIGVDISLFDHPNFPYSKDKPPCFYTVRVDGDRSSFDAFYDEKLRWKMILNRIMYSGGFIDNKQVLTAMNVTRTCKQPSWFSQKLAERVITQYCTQDVIVDPFAGWGTRHDAAVALGKQYIGGDFNPELVRWHYYRERNIKCIDAHKFKHSGPCSVFICPPYSDPQTGRCFEDYNFEGFDASAKALSQCDWLKIVMKNVPNASEYIMVCKIVDEDFKPFIKETLENKSHFGTNNEYVIVIKNGELNP